MPETAIIPARDLAELREWLKAEYDALKRREAANFKNPLKYSIHNQISELIKVADHAGLDLLEGKRLNEE